MKPISLALLCSLSLSVLGEPVTLRLMKAIPLPGVKGRFDHFAMDVKGHRLLVAALGNDTLEVVDVAAGKHLQSITGLRKPTSVIYYTASNEIGVAGGDDGTFKVFDGNFPISGDTDDVFYDPRFKRLYLSCGEGFVDVVGQNHADRYRLLERIPTRVGARTSFFSAELGGFYLAVPRRDLQEAEIRVFQPQE